MKYVSILVLITILVSCSKTISVELPYYDTQIAVEMYVEEGQPLRCLLTESLPYSSDSFSRRVDSALVIVSDGKVEDTLMQTDITDWETGRIYNYANPKKVSADPTKNYRLRITPLNKPELTATTSFLFRATKIDSVNYKATGNKTDSFSVGFVMTDRADTEDYYRVMIAKKISDFNANQSDFYLSDVAINGKLYSYYSEPDYSRGDTVTVRVYSLRKEHYEYLQSTENARRANFNPFVQPADVKSNISGGIGIFTTILYDEKKIIIR